MMLLATIRFALGHQSFPWMAAIALYCAAEKILPGAETWGKYAGVAMLGGGALMIGTTI